MPKKERQENLNARNNEEMMPTEARTFIIQQNPLIIFDHLTVLV